MKYRVDYRYIAPNCKLRVGAYIVEAKDVKDAETKALDLWNQQHRGEHTDPPFIKTIEPFKF